MLGKEVIKNGIKYSLKQSITINIKWIHIGHQHFVTKRDLQNYICVCVYVYMYVCVCMYNKMAIMEKQISHLIVA